MRPNRSLLDSLLELQALDRLPRTGYALRGVDEAESIAEHGFHLGVLVWAVAPSVPEVDLARVLELALVHDLAEIRIGDLPRTAGRYLPEGAKAAAESAALAELLAPLGDRGPALFAEFEAGETREARLVRACDKLQLMIKVFVYERWGATGLGEFWDNEINFPRPGFAPVDELLEELHRRREVWLAARQET
ncbi:MAG: HD domain-containing protein [Thermoanaerobaculia bacterium]